MGVRIVGDLGQLQATLRKMQAVQMPPIARQIGEALVSSTIRRFGEQKAPDGTPWQPLAAATVAPRAKDYGKRGKIKKGAEARLQGRKILIQSARLRNSISARVGGSKVAVGTNVVYARIHQFGGQAGRGKKVRIPARPYLGISRDDQEEIARIVSAAVGGG